MGNPFVWPRKSSGDPAHRMAVEGVIERASEAVADPLDRLVRLLRCCGFLAERRPEGVVIGDNASPADREVLAAYSPMGPEALAIIPWASLLSRRSSGSEYYGRSDRFLRRRHGYKYPALALDGMAAYLVKALSAVGVLTSYSCDGHGSGDVCIAGDSGCNGAWATVLFRGFVATRIALTARWEVGEGRIMGRSTGDLGLFYSEVLDVADLLYRHRVSLRDCRRRVIEELDPEIESNRYESILLNIDLISRSGDFAWPHG